MEENKEASDFVQDESFLNSLDFINGFSDIDEKEAEAVENSEPTGQADGDMDLNAILNETAPDVSDGMIAEIADIANIEMPVAEETPSQEMISDYTSAPEMPAEFTVPEEPESFDMNAGLIAETPTQEMVTDYAADMPVTDVPAEDPASYKMNAGMNSEIPVQEVAEMPAEAPTQEMVSDYAATADIPAENEMTGIPQVDESAGVENDDAENEDESEEDYDYDDDIEEESMMIVTEGTTITGSIGTNTSMLILGSVNGDITCEGKLTISGKVIGNSFAMDVFVNSPRVEGNIGCTGTLKISQGTVVIGDISAGAAAIAGAVKGNLDITGPVILDSTAVIKGNIKAKSVQLINGAVLEGFCTLEYSDSQLDEIFANDAG